MKTKQIKFNTIEEVFADPFFDIVAGIIPDKPETKAIIESYKHENDLGFPETYFLRYYNNEQNEVERIKIINFITTYRVLVENPQRERFYLSADKIY